MSKMKQKNENDIPVEIHVTPAPVVKSKRPLAMVKPNNSMEIDPGMLASPVSPQVQKNLPKPNSILSLLQQSVEVKKVLKNRQVVLEDCTRQHTMGKLWIQNKNFIIFSRSATKKLPRSRGYVRFTEQSSIDARCVDAWVGSGSSASSIAPRSVFRSSSSKALFYGAQAYPHALQTDNRTQYQWPRKSNIICSSFTLQKCHR